MSVFNSVNARILAFVNQKGGVGKTTTVVNVATALAAIGKRVLLVDMDPQGNATTGLGIRRKDIKRSAYDVLAGQAKAYEAAIETKVPGLSVLASSVHLSGAEVELVNAERREYRMKEALHTKLPYDYILIDCPPSLNLLTLNSLVAAHSIIVPMQCEYYALEGLSHLTKTVSRIQKHFNPYLDVHGIVLTMYEEESSLTRMIADDVRKYFGEKVYKTTIPRNVRLSEAPSYGLPALIYDMKCAGAQSYIKLAKEIINRERDVYNQTEVA